MRSRFSVDRRSPSMYFMGCYLCLEPNLPVATPVAGYDVPLASPIVGLLVDTEISIDA